VSSSSSCDSCAGTGMNSMGLATPTSADPVDGEGHVVAADESPGASPSWWSTTCLGQADDRVLHAVVGRILTGGDGGERMGTEETMTGNVRGVRRSAIKEGQHRPKSPRVG
jgi:hypothetical protein